MNSRNRTKLQNTSSVYNGVSWKKGQQKWEARIKDINGRKLYLGCFNNEKDAARAYNNKAIELGISEYCNLNNINE
jgi:hypothetical protein